ncbi:MAG: RNA methyltransferase [Pseudomonadota bacterium]
MRRNQEGIDSLDAFARAFARIEAEETGLTIVGGQGEATHRVASLENLARDWAGEEYWFWARRVLRKVRYGVRQTDELLDAPFAASDAPSILLMEPQIAENVGMAARAMANFGLDDLHIIKPRDGWPSEKARAVASGASAIIDGAGVHGNLGEAISDLHWVAATTARQRDLRKPVLTPEQAAAEMRRRTARGERCGILFGRERNGLQSDEVADCNAIVMIPVNRKFASLNLAQSVLLMGYAWLCSGSDATLGRVTDRERRLSTGLNLGHDVPAKQSDRERFFEHLETELDARGFFTPPERKPITVRNLRSMFLRADLTAQEVRTLRGIVVTLTRRPRNGHQSGQ